MYSAKINTEPVNQSVANSSATRARSLPAVPILKKAEKEPLPHVNVIQRKLEKGKLNIVGEYHSWSDGRREQEKEFVRDNDLGGYWTEAEFKIQREGKPDHYGDDPILRALQASIELIRMCEDLIAKETAFRQNQELPPDKIEIVNTIYVERIGKQLQQVLYNISFIEEDKRSEIGNLGNYYGLAQLLVNSHSDNVKSRSANVESESENVKSKSAKVKLSHIIRLSEFIRN